MSNALASHPRKRAELFRRNRIAGEIPLEFVAALRAQEFKLFLAFHAFGQRGELQGFREVDDGDRDGPVVGIGTQVVDERTVDLEFVDRIALQIAQRRIAGAEIVDRDFHAERAQSRQRGTHDLLVHQQAFGQFEFQVAAFEAGLLQHAFHIGHQFAAMELGRRDVD